ncbi:hypothetical protein FQA47_008545 [Oryzias melastigma]|uniref:Uncharacterized protein n=1 Tax=Oryzias melastigma TaxID=30732 RepID=A0A834C0D4_ORYME|nr:hypothetical protein FQA47_008545 [Oryzias melastigma]
MLVGTKVQKYHKFDPTCVISCVSVFVAAAFARQDIYSQETDFYRIETTSGFSWSSLLNTPGLASTETSQRRSETEETQNEILHQGPELMGQASAAQLFF